MGHIAIQLIHVRIKTSGVFEIRMSPNLKGRRKMCNFSLQGKEALDLFS